MAEQKIVFEHNGRKKQITACLCNPFLGKMFSFSKKPVLFVFDKEKNVGIHMLFVFRPLQVFWLDRNKKVVKARRMLPFVSFANARAKYVLEVPQ